MKLQDFVGKRIKHISGMEKYSDEIIIDFHDGYKLKFAHSNWGGTHEVLVEDVCGDESDLIGEELLTIKESSNSKSKKGRAEWENKEMVWTFYSFATAKGYVDIRWYGCHNGYYSASVDAVYQKDQNSSWEDVDMTNEFSWE